MKKKTSFILGLLTFAIIVAVGPLLPSNAALAAGPAKWIDKGTIELDGKKYIDSKPIDSSRDYYQNGDKDEIRCFPVIKSFNADNTSAKLYKRKSVPTFPGTSCVDTDSETITFEASSVASATKEVGAAQGQKTHNSCEAKGGVLSWIMCPVLKILDVVFNWLDTQIQALLEINEDAYTHPLLYQAWSNIRNIAFIVLIPVMLVMVIGTAFGFEMFSAYTVKKALPRMVAAILFITLSWYICIFLIGFFNVIGGGMIGLITNPFGLKGTITLMDLFTPSFGGFVVQGGGLAVGILAVAFTSEALIPILLLYFGGAVLVFFLAFLILTIRQMMILGLILAAPLAILAWIFPGNDKMWKLWWGTFSKLLIMFPLITSLIAMGRVFAYLVGNTPAGGLQGGLINPLLKITAYIMPYVLIPLTFKFAGGAFATLTGAVNDRGRGLFDRMKKGRQENWKKLGHNAKGGKLLRLMGDENSRTSKLNKFIARQALQHKAGFAVGAARTSRLNSFETVQKMKEAEELMENKEVAEPVIKDDDKLEGVHGDTREEIRKILIARAPGRFNERDKKADLDQAVEEIWNFKKAGGRETASIAATIAQAGTGTGYNYQTDEDGNFTYKDDMNMAILRAAGGDASLAARMLAKMRPMAVQSGRPGLAGGGFANHLKTLDYLRTATSPANRSGEVTRIAVDPSTGEELWETVVLPDGTQKKQKKTIKTTYSARDALYDIQHDVIRSNAAAAIAGKRKDVQQVAAVIQDDAVAAMKTDGAEGAKRAIRMLASIQGKHDSSAAVAPQNADVWADEVMTHEIDVSTLGSEFKKLIAPALIDRTTGQQKQRISIQDAMEVLHDDPQWTAMRNEFRRTGINAAQAFMQSQAMATAAQQAGINPAVPPPVQNPTGFNN